MVTTAVYQRLDLGRHVMKIFKVHSVVTPASSSITTDQVCVVDYKLGTVVKTPWS